METYQTILERKQKYYGKTEASYEFAAEEYAISFSKNTGYSEAEVIDLLNYLGLDKQCLYDWFKSLEK